MKKTIIVPALVAVLGFALASAPVTIKAQAATTSTSTTTPSKPAKPKSNYTQFPKGATISAIDASSITLKTSKGDLKLAIDAKTGFQVDKKKAAATDFAAGDAVTGSYSTGADGSLTAHNVRKKAAK